MTYGLKSGLWVRATIRRFNQNGHPSLIVKKGDEDAGAIFIHLADANGQSAILQEQGHSWRRHEIKSESSFENTQAVNVFFEKQIRYDPDLWIIEIAVKDIASPIETLLETRKISD